MNIDFEFSENGRSVITPDGEIFLFGGRKLPNGELDNSVMEFNFEDNSFTLRKRRMPVAKKNFSAKYMNKKIYIVGVI